MNTKDNPKPDPSGMLYDSQTVWYKLAGLGDYIRPIGQKTKESVASTAFNRMNKAGSEYKPPNLQDYIKRGGAVTRVP